MDWVALSFVQKPGDMIEARGLIGDRAGLVAKIEKPSALDQIDDIIRLSDAVMVARGDLGVEIPHEDVPGRQKELVRACRLAVQAGDRRDPDARFHGHGPDADARGGLGRGDRDLRRRRRRHAVGGIRHGPVSREAVEMMDRIIRSTEQHKLYRSIIEATEPGEEQTAPHAVAAAAADLAEAIEAPAIVAFTSSGTTAARIARKRPPVPILAMTPDLAVSRRLCLLWGAHSVLSGNVHSYEEMVTRSAETAMAEDFARPPDQIVVVAGIPFGQAGTTNNLRVVQLGEA